MVSGADVFVGAAGIWRPRVVVSAGALAMLDDDELRAAIDHEYGHVSRRHRFVLLVAEVCRAFGRFVPGAHHAARELRFHLERDADRWAIARCNRPVALASAICKAAVARRDGDLAFATLAGGSVTRRVRELLDDEGLIQPASMRQRWPAQALGAAMIVTVAAVPFVGLATLASRGDVALGDALVSMLAC